MACLPVGWDEGVGQIAQAESSIADDNMDWAALAAISQIWLAGAVVDGAGTLVDVVMPVECHVNLRCACHC